MLREYAKRVHFHLKEYKNDGEFSSVFFMEAISWLLTMTLTGLALLRHYIFIQRCSKVGLFFLTDIIVLIYQCTHIAVELCFVFIPTLIASIHPILGIINC